MPTRPPPPTFHFADAQWRSPARVFALVHREYGVALHTHQSIEVNLVTGGTGRHRVGGHWLPVARGDGFVIPPGTAHAYEDHGGLTVHHLLIGSAFVADRAADLVALPGWLLLFTVEPFFRARTPHRHSLRLAPADCDRVAARIEEIAAELAADPPDCLGAEGLATHVVTSLCRMHGATRTDAGLPHRLSDALARVVDGIDQRFGERLTLAELARIAGLRPDRLGVAFRAATGMTPMSYLTRVRVQAAQRMLLDGDRSVTRIAHDAGFYDSAHFSRTFSRTVGMTPRAYRHRNRLE